MALKVYNVLTRTKELFVPEKEGKVKMYACGITASGDAHIGHAYQAIVFDMIKKYLEYIGYAVTYVRNYTDVDDKIIIKARELGVNPKTFAEEIMRKTDVELERLGVEKPTIQSKATECIEDMIDYISKLIKSGHAYATENGDVFFSVESFANYGKFSNRITEESISGVRKDVEPGKRDERDFALWKNAKNDEIFWDSPWGNGRPGWHIECSTMSMKYLGETLDIHGGGKDLVFPHHENEIAQSESLTGKQFAKYWIHNGLIQVNGQKMSKSLNNGILLQDLLKEYNKDVIRMTLLQNNYRTDMNIIDGIFEVNEDKIYSIYKLFELIDELGKDCQIDTKSSIIEKVRSEFIEAMDNDFNTSLAIANLLNYISDMSKNINNPNSIAELVNTKYVLINVYKVLGLLQQNPKDVVAQIKNKYMSINNITEEEIESLIQERSELKKEGKYNEADDIRKSLLKRGIELKDTREKTDWDINISSVAKK